jgi:alpha-methylacyl-CoA racemase
MDVAPHKASQGPLRGVRVVELAGIGPSQLGVMLLADLGADVVRVDRPAAAGHDEDEAVARARLMGRGRRSIAVDLKDPRGVGIVQRLADGADVLVDPFRPGVAERLGLGPDAVLERNPRLVFARMTGWGQEGPLARAAGHDLNFIALAGALEPMGAPGDVPPVPLNLVGDYGGGGMLLAFGIVSALLERERSGRGQVLDVAMVDGVATLLADLHQARALGEWAAARGANFQQGASPWYRAYRAADGGFVTVGPIEPRFYALLLERLGLSADDWPQWDAGRWPALAALLERIFAERTVGEWRELLEGTDACFAPALGLGEAPEHPHLRERGTYVERDGVVQPAPVPRFSRTPGALGAPPPRVGEHTAEVLGELGLDVEELLRDGVVVAPARR